MLPLIGGLLVYMSLVNSGSSPAPPLAEQRRNAARSRWDAHKEAVLRAYLKELKAQGVEREARHDLLEERNLALEHFKNDWVEFFKLQLTPGSDLHGRTFELTVEPPHLKERLAERERRAQEEAEEEKRWQEVRAQEEMKDESHRQLEETRGLLEQERARVRDLEEQLARTQVEQDPTVTIRKAIDSYLALEKELQRELEEQTQRLPAPEVRRLRGRLDKYLDACMTGLTPKSKEVGARAETKRMVRNNPEEAGG